MHRKTRLKLTDLNPLLTCSLCKGYLIDATTLTECLHSFCRSCLVRYLQTSQQCPKCETMVYKTRLLQNASSSRSARSPGNLGVDRALQNIVYKLVPGLFKDEMKKRRDFYTEHPHAGTSSTSVPGDLEARGEVSEEALVIYSDDEHMNLSLEYFIPYNRKRSGDKKESDHDEPTSKRSNGDTEEEDDIVHKRYLRCPAAVCVKHIKKFIRNKFDLKPSFQVEITHVDNEEDSLPDDYTLMDVAYIYTWRRNGPLPLVFRVFKEAPTKRQKTGHVTEQQPVVDHDKSTRADPTTADHAQEADQDHSEHSTNPPPCLDKESADVNETGEHQKGPEATLPVNLMDSHSAAENSVKTTNGDGERGSVSAVVVQGGNSPSKDLLKSTLHNATSNNNENSEVVEGSGKNKDNLPSLGLKSTLDLPPALATVGLVPAR